jgi:hypothetical protein
MWVSRYLAWPTYTVRARPTLIDVDVPAYEYMMASLRYFTCAGKEGRPTYQMRPGNPA